MRYVVVACRLALAAALLVPAAAASADRLPDHAPLVVDYRIDVKLDSPARQLHGRERVTWRNPSSDVVSELWFHLYLNAFKNNRSTFMKESGGQLRGDQMATDKWGWIDVTSIKLADGRDLIASRRFEHPDDDNADDQTVMRVVLPEPVPPGGSAALDIDFTAELPQVFARTGYRRDFYMVGQWFPKLGVYEPAGMRGRAQGGWNCHQFHANSEFYADFGHFLVNITVPANFVVGATGVRKDSRIRGREATYTYEQSDVHDFAWTADPDYVEVTRHFSATKDVSATEYDKVSRLLGRPLSEMKLTDVDILLLIHRSRMPQAQAHIDSAVEAIKDFGLWYGRYPYPTLTIVDPAPGAAGAFGMEYPTLITAGTSATMNYWPFNSMRNVEGVVIHEFGHQFWYGMVANNEFEEAWLDEGITSYSTGKVAEFAYGSDATIGTLMGIKLPLMLESRSQNSPNRRSDPILNFSWQYESSGAYGFASYAKPEIVLRTLEGYLGEQTMARVMRTYHERWRFGHPSSEDFFAVANEVAGKDLSWFFNEAMRGTGILDYAVASATTRATREPVGVFDGKSGRTTKLAKDAKRTEDDRADTGPYESTVLLQRRGEFVFPVDVALTFSDGHVERVAWDGRDRWKKIRVTRPQKLLSANIDPERKVWLDVDWLNNWMRVEPDRRVAFSWATRVTYWVQNILTTLSGL